MSNLMETLITDGRFNTFVSALQAANLTDTLTQPGPYTVFAPTDDAFVGLADGVVDTMMSDIPSLTNLLLYHIVSGKQVAADVLYEPELKSVEGNGLKIQRIDGKPYINDAQILFTDVMAENGVIHVIDSVLLPPKP